MPILVPLFYDYFIGHAHVLLLQQIVPHAVGHSMSTLPATTAAPGRPNTGAQAPGNAVVVAVVVVVVIIAAMLAAVFGLVVILVIFRRRAKRSEIAYTNDGEDSLKELDNPMYSATVTGNKIFVITQLYSNKCTHFVGEKFDS